MPLLQLQVPLLKRDGERAWASGVACFWQNSDSRRRCRAAVRNQRSRIPIPEEGRTVAAPYEGGAVTSFLLLSDFGPFFSTACLFVGMAPDPMKTSVSALSAILEL